MDDEGMDVEDVGDDGGDLLEAEAGGVASDDDASGSDGDAVSAQAARENLVVVRRFAD